MTDINLIKKQLEQDNIESKLNEKLGQYTSFKIGGECKILCLPKTKDELAKTITTLKSNNLNYMIIGNGSNILFLDEGFDGAIIVLANNFCEITLLDDNTIEATAGVSITKLCKFALEHGLTGLENLYGIPATVGGAVYMNAGAYGSETKDTLQTVQHIDENANLVTMTVDKLDMTYRHSFYSDKDFCIVSAVFKLEKDDKATIKEKMTDVMQRRVSKQPLEYPSAGSTFKRPVGAFAGQLIEECGLKGFSVGGAKVSEKHAGFVINYNNATCKDVLDLVHHVQKTVKENTGFTLECEVKIPKR